MQECTIMAALKRNSLMVAVITSTSSCVKLKDKNGVSITADIFILFRALGKDGWNWKTNKLKICYSALVKHLKIFDKHLKKI